jgi:HEAT repeats
MTAMRGEKVTGLAVAIAAAVAAADEIAATAAIGELAALSGREWLRLDEVRRRSWTDREPGVVPAATPAVELFRLALTSMDRNGWKRQAAVEALATASGTVAAAAIALRVSDWVEQVAATAARCLRRPQDDEGVAATIAVLLAGADRSRGIEAAGAYLDGCAAGSVHRLRVLAGSRERPVRVWALGCLADRQAIDEADLVALATRDNDPAVARWAATRLLGDGDRLAAEVVAALLTSRRAVVRSFATRHAAAAELTRSVLRALLLDRSGAVRATARWRWGQRWGSPAQTYLDALATGSGPAMTAAALHGLDDCAHPTAVQVAVPHLHHPSPTVRRAAVRSVGRRGGSDQVIALLPGLLLDPAPRVSAAANRYLSRVDAALPEQVWTVLAAASTPAAARIALTLRQRQGSWERVGADLEAMTGEGELVDLGRRDLIAWLRCGAASTYTRPTADQATRITRLLDLVDLAESHRREIAFTAELPAPAARRAESPDRPSPLGRLLTWRR